MNQGDKMKTYFQAILNLFPCFIAGLYFPVTALAQDPGRKTSQIQPALILALALTSLVLFCFYLFQKNRAEKENNIERNKWTSDQHPLQIRLHETHKALNSLFAHSGIPMAKTAMEQGKIIDVTPALYQPLGYTKQSFLKESPEVLGLLATEENDIQNLVENGWTQFSSSLPYKTTPEKLNCYILNIVTQYEGCPMVVSIVPDLSDKLYDAPRYSENLS